MFAIVNDSRNPTRFVIYADSQIDICSFTDRMYPWQKSTYRNNRPGLENYTFPITDIDLAVKFVEETYQYYKKESKGVKVLTLFRRFILSEKQKSAAPSSG